MKHLARLFIDKSTYGSRWSVFWFSVPCGLGIFFIYQLPATLKIPLKAYFDSIQDYVNFYKDIDDDLFEIYFAALFSLYTFFNIFLPFVSGGLRDVLGSRVLLITSLIQTIIGQITLIYGLSTKSFFTLYIGRIITGWGIETMLPIQAAYLTPYFKKDYFSFTVSTFQMFGLIGIVICILFAPKIAEEQGVIHVFYIGLYIILFFTIFVMISVFLDRKAENESAEHEQYQEVPQTINQESEQQEKFISYLDQFIISKPAQIKEEKLVDKIEEAKQEMEIQQPQVNNTLKSEFYNKQGFFTSAFSLREIEAFPKLFWLIVLYYTLQFSSIILWMNNSVEYFTEKWLINYLDSQNKVFKIFAIMYLLSAILMPILGVLVDYVGHRSSLAIIAAIMSTISHIMVMFYQPIIGLVFLGFGLSLSFSSLYPSIVYIIEIEKLGKAYSFMTIGLNIALTILSISVGVLKAYKQTMIYSQILLIGVSFLAILASILIYFEDRKTGKNIHKAQMNIEESDFISSILEGLQGSSQFIQQDREDQEQVEQQEQK